MSETDKFSFRSIGIIESQAKYRYELPRQSIFTAPCAFLRWNERIYRECAEDLKGFDRIWLIWVFDRNTDGRWHPKVRVPVPAEKDCYSVFATRSPYRPNPVGISAVELLEITPEGLKLGACDLLDGTAVIDVKPYIPEVDSFPDSKAGWRDTVEKNPYTLIWSQTAAAQADFIFENGNFDLRNFCDIQLSYRPLDSSRKRVEINADGNLHILRFRTWKIFFAYDGKNSKINISSVQSNYSASDLLPDSADKYGDKDLHRRFNEKYFSGE